MVCVCVCAVERGGGVQRVLVNLRFTCMWWRLGGEGAECVCVLLGMRWKKLEGIGFGMQRYYDDSLSLKTVVAA